MPKAGPTDANPSSALTVTIAVAGFAVALFGVYWDDAWHTDRGRDSLLSAPHLALYTGVAVAVGVVGWWGWRQRSDGWRLVIAGPVGIAVVGAAVTLGSAPVDEWWHQSFGRDAVLWSPPHLLAVVGTIALGAGVLLVAGRSGLLLHHRFGPAILAAAGAASIGSWQVLVLEYDTDVAQFSALWYLPVLATGLSAAALTVQVGGSVDQRASAAWAAAAYTVAMIVVIVALWLMGFSTPIVPAVVPAAVVADLTRTRGWSVPMRSFAFVVVLFGVYLPYLRVVPGGVSPSVGDAALGAAFGVGAVAVTIVLFDPAVRWRRPPGSVPAATVVIFMISVLLVSAERPALAHDPGQGVEVAPIMLTAEVTDQSVDITATFDESVPDYEPERVLARRAGRVVEGSLASSGSTWVGRVQLDDDGRWFVYVEARRGEEVVEAWLPVDSGDTSSFVKRTDLYLLVDSDEATRPQVLVGVVLVVLAVAIVGRIAWTVRVGTQAWPERQAP